MERVKRENDGNRGWRLRGLALLCCLALCWGTAGALGEDGYQELLYTMEGDTLIVREDVTDAGEVGLDWDNPPSIISTVRLPLGLTRFPRHAFEEFGYDLHCERFEIPEGNPYFKTVDGVLFSKDGTVLIKYPSGRGGSYTIPEGTQRLAYRAFGGCRQPLSLTFPSTMKDLTNLYCWSYGGAFCEPRLAELHLPASMSLGLEDVKPFVKPDIQAWEARRAEERKEGWYGSLWEARNKAAEAAEQEQQDQSFDALPTDGMDWELNELPDWQKLRIEDADGPEILTLAAEHPYGVVRDGVLFHQNGTLLWYPAAKQDRHYDVPPGTRSIAAGAFARNPYLESVSLPLGLTDVQDRAFENCDYLRAVALPLTLEWVGAWAFSDCVNLRQTALPSGVFASSDAFDNCPSLTGIQAEAYEPNRWEPNRTYALVNPENRGDAVALLEQPDAQAPVIASLPCGALVTVYGQTGAYCRVETFLLNQDGATEGYLPRSQLQMMDYLQELFAPVYATPAPGEDGLVTAGTEYLLPETPLTKWPASPEPVEVWSNTGQAVGLAASPTGGWSFAPVSRLTLYAREIPPGKRYGFVISGDPRARLHLRAGASKASQSLGKFFSGVQVEILGEEGDFYQVRVGFDQGYMMKEFVREVKEWTGT